MPVSERSPDVIIAGGGMVGAALGLALSDSLLHIRLAEARPLHLIEQPDNLERASLIAEGSSRFLQTLGTDIGRIGTPVKRMRVWDDDHFGGIQLDAEEVGAAQLGFIVENRQLEQALHRLLAGRSNVALAYGARLQSPQPWGDEIGVDDGDQHWRTRLLAIAEGRESGLRQALGIPTLRSNYEQQGIIATVWTERPHGNTAFQRFLPTGPIAMLPFSPAPDGSPRCSLVWSARDSRARGLMALEDEAFLRELQLAFGPVLGRLYRIGPRAAFPLSALHARSYINERSVLLGDSAHGVHPLAGLGVNLGLRDAECLSGLVREAARRGEDWGRRELLRRYEVARRPDNLATLAATDSFHRLFSNRIAPLAWLRNAGMLAAQLTPPLKRVLIRQAMGLGGRHHLPEKA